jgi:hypothetical protein
VAENADAEPHHQGTRRNHRLHQQRGLTVVRSMVLCSRKEKQVLQQGKIRIRSVASKVGHLRGAEDTAWQR